MIRPVAEVFRTNVEVESQSEELLALLREHFPGTRINFDLQDCDRILRVAGDNIEPGRIIAMLNMNGFECQVLE